eukprot:8513278-Pyramimonas_sp.AAC.1
MNISIHPPAAGPPRAARRPPCFLVQHNTQYLMASVSNTQYLPAIAPNTTPTMQQQPADKRNQPGESPNQMQL